MCVCVRARARVCVCVCVCVSLSVSLPPSLFRQQAAQFQSFASGLYVPGFLLVAPMVNAIGIGRSYFIGCFSQMLQNLLFGLSSQTWQYYATTCLTSPTRALPQVALKTVTMQCASSIGMAQGELQGALSNLQTVCRIAAPMIWPAVFAWGTSRGRPQALYFCAAAANLVPSPANMYCLCLSVLCVCVCVCVCVTCFP